MFDDYYEAWEADDLDELGRNEVAEDEAADRLREIDEDDEDEEDDAAVLECERLDALEAAEERRRDEYAADVRAFHAGKPGSAPLVDDELPATRRTTFPAAEVEGEWFNDEVGF